MVSFAYNFTNIIGFFHPEFLISLGITGGLPILVLRFILILWYIFLDPLILGSET
uniref:Uncharacterized protein n=1 Tax=Rhizophora mucronata TaxID=61149 RepID=A0A2P2PY26_RHIMU